MRLIDCLRVSSAFLAAACLAQQSAPRIGTTVVLRPEFAPAISAEVVSASAGAVILEYGTLEKCWECGARYLMACSPSTPDCDVPEKLVKRVEDFGSIDAAIEFLNAPRAGEQKKILVRLLVGAEIPVERTVTRVETPRPPDVEDVVTYRVKK